MFATGVKHGPLATGPRWRSPSEVARAGRAGADRVDSDRDLGKAPLTDAHAGARGRVLADPLERSGGSMAGVASGRGFARRLSLAALAAAGVALTALRARGRDRGARRSRPVPRLHRAPAARARREVRRGARPRAVVQRPQPRARVRHRARRHRPDRPAVGLRARRGALRRDLLEGFYIFPSHQHLRGRRARTCPSACATRRTARWAA